MVLSVDHASIAALVLIVAAVAMRTVTSTMLGGMKKSLDEIRQKLHTTRAELGFEAELGNRRLTWSLSTSARKRTFSAESR